MLDKHAISFANFLDADAPLSGPRLALSRSTRMAERDSVPSLIAQAKLDDAAQRRVATRAGTLIETLRAKKKGLKGAIGVEALLQEYTLSSQEGVALMCLAEALLRIPDAATRDALIRDKIGRGDWQTHLGHSPSLFVNATSWGLYLTGQLTATHSAQTLTGALTRIIAKGGEPIIRAAVDMAVRVMSEHFVTGETIDKAIANARAWEEKGFAYSYDMLGEAAMSAQDAALYTRAYEEAITAIGRAAGGRALHEAPGISIKLSALHPRYHRSQRARVITELYPRVMALCLRAKGAAIGLNIDAEESERLDLSLDLLEALCHDGDLAGWHGLGFVVQAYQKRALGVVRHVIGLARESGHRLMVRLVKGAYWDSEIKRAQSEGMADFPVFTRKIHTDVSYLACAREMLGARDVIFPQFATHNALTLAHVLEMAGSHFAPGDYEFQCLHGMGEALYEEVVDSQKLGRPCRIYAPVGRHETLLAYLVRRLIENGANTSFVNRIADPNLPVDALTRDPVREAEAVIPLGAGHEKIVLPPTLYGTKRQNSKGLDLANEAVLRDLADELRHAGARDYAATPLLATPHSGTNNTEMLTIRNPANALDGVGTCVCARPVECAAAFVAAKGDAIWASHEAKTRAAILGKAAGLLEENTAQLLSLLMREAGKSAANASAEVREAVDFLRFYGSEAVRLGAAKPLGTVVCISPWNFPLAIFLGQIAAALAAGNSVIAKPAEETPLIAFEATRLLHEAGVPRAALQLLPGAGDVGAVLTAHEDCAGVLFTGSTEVAKLIQTALAKRLRRGAPPVLVAETGGQNAMVVDTSALTEQVVADVIASAFDSAGQRCSALRILCIQEEVYERTLAMLKGAMAELVLGDPAELATDIGPVISKEAQERLLGHIAAMQRRGFAVHTLPVPAPCYRGTFVAPTLIEVGALSDVQGEIFGPILHVLKYARAQLPKLLEAINAAGFGLTFGLHTRIDETIALCRDTITAGNLYINRNMIGAVVNVQPFGGHGLSGTGPKAGGPLQLARLCADTVPLDEAHGTVHPHFDLWRAHVLAHGHADAQNVFEAYKPTALLNHERELKGPVGEQNIHRLKARGVILVAPASVAGACLMIGAVLAAGSLPHVLTETMSDRAGLDRLLAAMPEALQGRIIALASLDALPATADYALAEGEGAAILALQQTLAARQGPIITLQARTNADLMQGTFFDEVWLYHEQSISTNTAAAGGNASLMAIG